MQLFLPAMVLATVLMNGSAEANKELGIGVGTSCGEWTAARKSDAHWVGYSAYRSWILGFLSGIGYAGGDGADSLKGMNRQKHVCLDSNEDRL